MINPHEDMPSTEEHACDIGGCCEPWAWETDRRNGPRKLRLCEEHATRWQMAERDLLAEIETVAGRIRPGMAKAIERRYGPHRVGPRTVKA